MAATDKNGDSLDAHQHRRYSSNDNGSSDSAVLLPGGPSGLQRPQPWRP